MISYSFHFFHPYVSFFFFFFFSTTHVLPNISILSFFYLYFSLNSRISLSVSPLLLCLPFYFYFLSSLAHFTHTADHDLLTSPLCLHFCFLFSFFFVSLHSHTQPVEIVFVFWLCYRLIHLREGQMNKEERRKEKELI